MTDHRSFLKAIRPTLDLAPVEESQALLAFQNETLRPILKLQHELVISLAQGTTGFDQLQHHFKTEEEYINLISHFISRQAELRHQLIGMIIGHFTLAEWSFYSTHKAEIKKRIVHMAAQRIASATGL